MAPSPVVARWELSRRLAARRKELGVDVKTITGELGFTRNYWSAVENDRTLIAEDKLRRLFPLLDFSDQDQSELLQLREDSRKRGWWDEYPILSDEHRRFYGMEAGAQLIRGYEGHVVPGLLQISAYSLELFRADPFFSPVDIEPSVTIRQRRREELLVNGTCSLSFILSEAALRQEVAGPAVQAQQLRFINSLVQANKERLGVRVLPLATNPGVIAGSSTLLLLEYASPHLPTVAFQEAVRPLEFVYEEDEQLRRLDLAWQDGASRSLGQAASVVLIEEIAESLERS